MNLIGAEFSRCTGVGIVIGFEAEAEKGAANPQWENSSLQVPAVPGGFRYTRSITGKSNLFPLAKEIDQLEWIPAHLDREFFGFFIYFKLAQGQNDAGTFFTRLIQVEFNGRQAVIQ
jgi:hypothetical protein